MDPLFCPFCPFSDPTPYFLSQHVETCHREADEPPFVPRHFLEDGKVENVGRKETANIQDTPSQDYIECECGEAVFLPEFDDHVQLHTAESADMAVDPAQLPEGVTLSPPNHHMTWPAAMSPLHLVDLNTLPAAHKAVKSPSHGSEARSSKLKHAARSSIDQQHPTLKEWIDLLLGSTAPTARTKSQTTHHKDVRRLGVGRNHVSGLRHRLIYQTEGGARAVCPRGADAGMAT
ncbi:MAG: hypothetical protein Q9216_000458 [Gyalolechia sp. 2 TL-2023]